MALHMDHGAAQLSTPPSLLPAHVQNQIARFQAKIFFQMDIGAYRIETASSPEDLKNIIQLRKHSFLEEFISDTPADSIDFDDFDLIADHVLLRNLNTQEVIGCYRIINSEYTKMFYSETQFYMDVLIRQPGIKIELGRACIHKNYRNGVTINLIWKGLAAYAKLANAKYMFGCASVKTMSHDLAHSMHWHLLPFYFNNQYDIRVLPEFKCPIPVNLDSIPGWTEVESSIPALLRTYLQAGATICSEPALDTYFRCVDFFTVLDLTKINPKYYKRYFA